MRADAIPYAINAETLYSNHKGQYSRRVERRQRKLAGKVTAIAPFLDAREQVLLVTTGCSPMGALEQWVTGVILSYLKRALFVFTNRGIFHLPATLGYAYRNSITTIRYEDCASIQIKGHSLIVRYGSGNEERFPLIARRERKKIRALLEQVEWGDGSSKRERTHLCPRCGGGLKPGIYTCAACRLEFRNRSFGRKLAILVPGGGYFYTGHPVLGLLDGFTELILLLALIVSLVDLYHGGSAIFAVAIFGLLLVSEKIVSVYHSNNFLDEFIPADREVKFRGVSNAGK